MVPSPKPLVSVVTPSFNSARFIRETIESVQMQDYPYIEHIVIDGGSTDGTVQILQEYPHLVWVSEPDDGQSDALNKGFRRAQGEIIGWLNADDTYEPNAISTVVNFLMENEQVDLIYSDARVIDENGEQIGITKAQPFDLKLLLISNYVNQPTVFMRRAVIEKLGGVNQGLHFVMDRELWLRAGLHFEMRYLPEKIIATFRLIPGTKSYEETFAFQSEWLLVLEQFFQTESSSFLTDKTRAEILRSQHAKYHIGKMVYAIRQRNKKSMFREFFLAISHNPKVAIDKGLWFYVAKGLLNRPLDRTAKYQR